jgi:hypothetical protein
MLLRGNMMEECDGEVMREVNELLKRDDNRFERCHSGKLSGKSTARSFEFIH